MITAGGWGSHQLRRSGMGGRGCGRFDHHLKDDFRRRMAALLGFGRSGVEVGGDGEAAVFKYERKKRSGDEVDSRGADGTRGVVVNGGGAGVKICADCKTTRTPLWRTGPGGPKTLCNACGIRYRKLRRKVGDYQANSKSCSGGGSISSSSSNNSSSRAGSFGICPSESELLKQRQRRKQEGLWLLLQQSRKFAPTCGEEEAEAAVLLMALSSGLFVHA